MKNNLITSRIKSFGYALKGLFYLIKTETNFQIHSITTILITVLGLYCDLSPTEWCLQCIVIALVLALEAINTAIEKTLDALHPEQHPKIGLAKDISAAAVVITSIFAVVIGLIIYIPKLIVIFT